MAGNRQAGLVLLLVLACLITVVGAGGPEDVPRSPPLAPAPSAVETRRDHWYTLELGDRPVGWMHRRRVHGADHSEGGAFVRTERRTHLQLVRGGTNVAIDTTATFVESPDGDPRSATARTRTGEALTQLQWRFTDDSILERREEDGRVATRERNWDMRTRRT